MENKSIKKISGLVSHVKPGLGAFVKFNNDPPKTGLLREKDSSPYKLKKDDEVTVKATKSFYDRANNKWKYDLILDPEVYFPVVRGGYNLVDSSQMGFSAGEPSYDGLVPQRLFPGKKMECFEMIETIELEGETYWRLFPKGFGNMVESLMEDYHQKRPIELILDSIFAEGNRKYPDYSNKDAWYLNHPTFPKVNIGFENIPDCFGFIPGNKAKFFPQWADSLERGFEHAIRNLGGNSILPFNFLFKENSFSGKVLSNRDEAVWVGSGQGTPVAIPACLSRNVKAGDDINISLLPLPERAMMNVIYGYPTEKKAALDELLRKIKSNPQEAMEATLVKKVFDGIYEITIQGIPGIEIVNDFGFWKTLQEGETKEVYFNQYYQDQIKSLFGLVLHLLKKNNLFVLSE